MTPTEVQNLKDKFAIDQVIGKYINLEYRGRKAFGSCPFHEDAHASLQVDLQRQVYTCFACGERGDVISFIRKIEHCSFNEAVLRLTNNAEEKHISSQTTYKKKNKSNKQIPPSVIPPYVQPEYIPYFSYEARHPDKDPSNPNEEFLSLLSPYLPEHPDLIDTYLDFEVSQAPSILPAHWKAFEGRVIYPIRNSVSDLIGFAGKGESPLYINTMPLEEDWEELPFFGYFQGQEKIIFEGELYIVEDYKDVLAMHAAGFINTITLSGTSLTKQQLQFIGEDVKDAYLLVNGNQPSRKTNKKLARILNKHNIKTRLFSLPEGYDPDSFFRERGKKEFTVWIEELTHPAHFTEEYLLAICLCYPRARVFLKDGKSSPFVPFLSHMLQEDSVPFVRERHAYILKQINHCEFSGPILPLWELLEDDLLFIATGLIEKHGPMLQQMHSQYMAISNMNEEEALSRLFLNIMHEYYEERLYKDIAEIISRYRPTPCPNDMDTLLSYLDDRKESNFVTSCWLERMGVN